VNRRYALIRAGVVETVAVADDAQPLPRSWAARYDRVVLLDRQVVEPGWLYDGASFTEPPELVALRREFAIAGAQAQALIDLERGVTFEGKSIPLTESTRAQLQLASTREGQALLAADGSTVLVTAQNAPALAAALDAHLAEVIARRASAIEAAVTRDAAVSEAPAPLDAGRGGRAP
jgi:hypothetical protein